MSLNKDPRRWFYYPIEIPLNEDGDGPVPVKEATSIVYEVWDIFCKDCGTFDNLPDAIKHAIKLNTGHKTEDHIYCENFYKEREDNELV